MRVVKTCNIYNYMYKILFQFVNYASIFLILYSNYLLFLTISFIAERHFFQGKIFNFEQIRILCKRARAIYGP